MENFSFYQENIATAAKADGTLNEQAEIYAESWEAARDRVSAAAQDLYSKFLDDDFFITFLNALEKSITGVSKLSDAFGGLAGILSTVGFYASKIFQ
jgi:predicted ribonuclease toxin of YeeF-YezG toxin-antitoxin module